MSGGERPIGAAKGEQSDTEALCQPPLPPSPTLRRWAPWGLPHSPAPTPQVIDKSPKVSFDDIAGLGFAKKCVEEAVVWPMLRPDLFTGLRGPPKGLLLFGPPGTGKTLIGKAIASLSGSTFFSISSSSLMSKWVGEGEKMVCAAGPAPSLSRAARRGLVRCLGGGERPAQCHRTSSADGGRGEGPHDRGVREDQKALL